GRNCAFGGQVGIGDHAEVGDRVFMGGKTGVAAKKKIASDQILLGAPARTLSDMKKLFALENRLIKQASKHEAPEGE
ncbi:MAG TPA: UDP-3-O-(3-hydroxymyristoyl)glucosamine N-acyltransferase, partial [bacterium]|nr:UDP-3-O-(3-hydroxymyristoyl)glucosamine N-acyltransferase [bacterium]